jgi:hypothetical protein
MSESTFYICSANAIAGGAIVEVNGCGDTRDSAMADVYSKVDAGQMFLLVGTLEIRRTTEVRNNV